MSTRTHDEQKEVLDFEYDSTYFRRGLVIDKERGNVIKMDRHKYVRQVYHGFTPLQTAVRKELYMSTSESIPLYTESNFVNIDTLFLLVDAYLFAQLVELKDKTPGAIPHSYATIYAHIRQCVDLCHRDGVIKVRFVECLCGGIVGVVLLGCYCWGGPGLPACLPRCLPESM
jgi:5'-nucleotidase